MEIRQIIAEERVILGLGIDNKVYTWDMYTATWKLHWYSKEKGEAATFVP